MAKYISKYSGERIDHAVGTIPSDAPSEDSILVVSLDDEEKQLKSKYVKFTDVSVSSLNIQNGAGENSLIQKSPNGKPNNATKDGTVVFGQNSAANQKFDIAMGGAAVAGFANKAEFENFYYDFDTNKPLHGGKGLNAQEEVLDFTGNTYENSFGWNRSFGEGSTAKGRSSVAFQNGQAVGVRSTSFGNSTASGNNAFSTGDSTNASGSNTFTQGNSTTAGYDNQAAFGRYNENKEENIFEVGIGSGEPDEIYGLPETKNAFEVLRDGRAKVQSVPTENDDVVRKQELDTKVNYSDIGQGLTVVDGKIKANVTKIQNTDSTEFAPDSNGVVTIPDAAKEISGLVKVDSNFGLSPVPFQSTPKGTISVASASTVDIGKRTNVYKPIASNNLNYAVKAALTDDNRMGTEASGTNTAFTDEEKDRACEIIGASRKLYRHYITFESVSYGSCTVSFISLKSDAYSSAENLSELKDVVSVEYCVIGNGAYTMGTFFINPTDGDYTLLTSERMIVFTTGISSLTDAVTEL